MKRFVKYFFIIFGITFVAFIALIHWSGFQKACLLGILRCNYKEVILENFHGGPTTITWDKLLCKDKKNALVICNFELKWHPWRLLFGRTLSMDVLRCDVDFSGDSNRFKQAQTQQAGWFSSRNSTTTYSLLKNLQSPVRLDIASANLNLTFSSNGIQLQEGHLKLQDMHPGQTGTFRYNGKMALPNQVRIATRGEFSLQESSKGAWEKIRCAGEIKTSYKNTRYPKLSFNGIIDGITSNSKEEIKAEIHCGQANDFLLTGECIKDSERVYDFKWQGFFDHSLLKFLNISDRPILSILTEGNGVFNRKHPTWTTHANLSAWGKRFEALHPSLKSCFTITGITRWNPLFWKRETGRDG